MVIQRLTQKVNGKYYTSGDLINSAPFEVMFNQIIDKLGKIEDIEEKYGTDYETLIKELSNGGIQ